MNIFAILFAIRTYKNQELIKFSYFFIKIDLKIKFNILFLCFLISESSSLLITTKKTSKVTFHNPTFIHKQAMQDLDLKIEVVIFKIIFKTLKITYLNP